MRRRGNEQGEAERQCGEMDVKPVPGLEHLPYAEVWFHELDDTRLHDASSAARALGKTGLEAWTTTRTPEVAERLAARGYEEVRRYVVSELDVAAAPDPGEPAYDIVPASDRPDLIERLYAIARIAYADQPGRAETRIDESWFQWGLLPGPAFVAVEDDTVLGYGVLNNFLAVAREARGRGVAGAVKRAQIAWAKANGVATLTTANEVRLEQMLALNRRLGYRPLYEEIVLRGPLV